MAGFTGADLAAAGAFSLAIFSSLLLLAVLSRARDDLLLSRTGWHMVAVALGLFAFRGLDLILAFTWMTWLGPLAGIAAAILLPLGLYFVLRAARKMEVNPHAPDR